MLIHQHKYKSSANRSPNISQSTTLTMAGPTKIEVSMAQPEIPPMGIMWKALFDNANPNSSKILFLTNAESKLLPWRGFGRSRGKELLFTNMPLTTQGIVQDVERQVQEIIQQKCSAWCPNMHVRAMEKLFPKLSDECAFYEKQPDGSLWQTEPDVDELHNSAKKTLSACAIVHINGVFFDVVKKTANLTFKLMRVMYEWNTKAEKKEDALASLMMGFGPIIPLDQQRQQQQSSDIIEAAVMTSGIMSTASSQPMPPPPPSPTQACSIEAEVEKRNYLSALSKARSIGGIQKRLRKWKRQGVDGDLLQWCEAEGQKHMNVIEERKQRKQQQQQKKSKPIIVQRDERHPGDPFRIANHSMDVDLDLSDDDDGDMTPGIFTGTFQLPASQKTPADTFLKMDGWFKVLYHTL